MSYIITYADEGTTDQRGNRYLRAKADDGTHGIHNVMFPKTGQISGVPSRYDLKNDGTQIEVKQLNWVATGKGGYYSVNASDIIGVVQQQNNNQAWTAIDGNYCPPGQLIALDPAIYTQCNDCQWDGKKIKVGFVSHNQDIIIYDAKNQIFNPFHTVQGKILIADGNIKFSVHAMALSPVRMRIEANVAVNKGIIKDFQQNPNDDPIEILDFTSGTPSNNGYQTYAASIQQYNTNRQNQNNSGYSEIHFDDPGLRVGQLIELDPAQYKATNATIQWDNTTKYIAYKNGNGQGYLQIATKSDLYHEYKSLIGKLLTDSGSITYEIYDRYSLQKTPPRLQTDVIVKNGVIKNFQQASFQKDPVVLIEFTSNKSGSTGYLPYNLGAEAVQAAIKAEKDQSDDAVSIKSDEVKVETPTEPIASQKTYRKFDLNRFKKYKH